MISHDGDFAQAEIAIAKRSILDRQSPRFLSIEATLGARHHSAHNQVRYRCAMSGGVENGSNANGRRLAEVSGPVWKAGKMVGHLQQKTQRSGGMIHCPTSM